MRTIMIAAACAALAAGTSAAQSPPALPASPAQAGTGQNWVVGGMQKPDDWQFVMGPTDQPDMGLKLIKAAPGGAIGFVCRTDGTETVGMAMKGVESTTGKSVTFEVTIGATVHDLEMVAQTPAPDGLTSFQYDGQGVSAMLQAMGAADPSAVLNIRFDDKKGHAVDFVLPVPRDLANVPASVCKGWGDKAEHAREAASIPVGPSTEAPPAPGRVPDSPIAESRIHIPPSNR